MHKTINTLATIAFRDFIKFTRDRQRLIATLLFPFIFVGVLGSSLESNLGDVVPYNFLAFTFTGVFVQVLFQSTASGVISLIEDKENDFAQELFIAPVSRITIIFGKILGESLVSFTQAIAVILFGIVLGVPFNLQIIVLLLATAVVAALFGGSFGVLIMSNTKDQRTANQIFPFVLFPQLFLAGVFAPINQLPPALLVLSRLMPLTYIVDLARHVYFAGTEYIDTIVIFPLWLNLLVIASLFLIFLIVGTWIFVRNSRQ